MSKSSAPHAFADQREAALSAIQLMNARQILTVGQLTSFVILGVALAFTGLPIYAKVLLLAPLVAAFIFQALHFIAVRQAQRIYGRMSTSPLTLEEILARTGPLKRRELLARLAWLVKRGALETVELPAGVSETGLYMETAWVVPPWLLQPTFRQTTYAPIR